MSRRDQSLEERRLELVQRSAAQRAALLGYAEPIVRKATAADRILTRVRSHPVLTALGAGALAALGARRLFGMATTLLTLYSFLQRR